MTASHDAHVGLPSEEEIVSAIANEIFEGGYVDAPAAARALLSLIRPVFEAKERDIQQLQLQIEEDRQTNAIGLACAYEQSRRLEAKLVQAVEDERGDIRDVLDACERGAAESRLRGFAHIGDLREGLSKLWALRDTQRASSASAAARGET